MDDRMNIYEFAGNRHLHSSEVICLTQQSRLRRMMGWAAVRPAKAVDK
jgi:hypothetical protein